MTEAAGLGSHNRDELKHQLATTGLRDLRVHIGYADESIDLAGSPRDLGTLFQLLYLQFAAPKLDTAAIHSWASLAQYQGPDVTLQNQLEQSFARGEPRLFPVTRSWLNSCGPTKRWPYTGTDSATPAISPSHRGRDHFPGGAPLGRAVHREPSRYGRARDAKLWTSSRSSEDRRHGQVPGAASSTDVNRL